MSNDCIVRYLADGEWITVHQPNRRTADEFAKGVVTLPGINVASIWQRVDTITKAAGSDQP